MIGLPFGHPIMGGYEDVNWRAGTPLWLGLSGLLAAPSRGVLVYSPALLLVVPALWSTLRGRVDLTSRVRIVLVAWVAASALTLLFFASWHDWWGGWSYGPRLLCETMPTLCLLFAVAHARLRRPWHRRAANGLVLASVAVHVVGIFGYSGYEAWQRRHSLPDQGRSLFALEDTQIEAHARALAAKLSSAMAGGK